MPMATKLGKVTTCLEKPLPVMSHGLFIMWSSEITQLIKNISTTIVPMATKLGRVFTYNEEFPLVKSRDPLIT